MVDDKQRMTTPNGTGSRDKSLLKNGQVSMVSGKKLSVFNSCRYCQGRLTESRELRRTMNENERLRTENVDLKKEIENLRQSAVYKSEVNEAKAALHEMKIDLQLIQDEKRDVIAQLDELHQLLNEKEDELRSFMSEYESKVNDHLRELQSLKDEKSQISQEKDEISHKYDGASEVMTSLRQKIAAKDKKIRDLEIDLAHTASYLTPAQVENRHRRSCNSDDYSTTNHRVTFTPNEGYCFGENGDLISSPTSAKGFLPNGAYLSSTEDIHSIKTPPPEKISSSKLGRKKKLVSQLSGSLSRAWGRTKSRKSIDASYNSTATEIVILSTSHMSLCDKTEDEKKEILEKSKTIPMHKWKADTVQVWLELVMCMPQYITDCAENIKSGKVLLGMTEEEFESCLGIQNPFHRRKLLHAIEEFHNPAVTVSTVSCAGQLDHWWVSEQWLTEIGMPQHADVFQENLIDGRMLDNLTRKDLERHLNIESKKHQDSIIRGIELLSMLGFDRQRLDDRRQMCNSNDTDLLVWSNARLMQWAKSVDLKEYAQNLRESGIHGALLVLDTSFTSDDLAVALGIPSSKTILRRHLVTEFDALVRPAREAFKEENCIYNSVSGAKRRSGSLSYGFTRSTSQTGRKPRRSLRAISKTFGKHLGRDYHHFNANDESNK